MNSPSDVTEEVDTLRPFWVPNGVSFDSLPEELKIAITGVINPAYRELVMSAASGLEQSTGLTIVHLLWLEILDQIQLGKGFAENSDEPDTFKLREKKWRAVFGLLARRSRPATSYSGYMTFDRNGDLSRPFPIRLKRR